MRVKSEKLVLIGVLLPLMAGTSAAQQEDHPLVTRYAGSKLTARQDEAFGRYKLVVGLDNDSKHIGRSLEGSVTRIVYSNPSGRSTLEIFANYRQALKAAGMETIFTCELNECGPGFMRSTWNRFNGLFAASDGDPRYLAGRIQTDGNEAYVALMVGRARTQLDIVEVKAMEGDLVTVDADALGQTLDREGRVSIYGILFDVDKTAIKPESGPVLKEIARLLKERPSLKLFVVGHTDMSGSFAHNMQLSRGRARAVVQALVGDYRISSSRLEGHGVGPLAPVAPNTSESGRAKNRRVELIAR